MDAWQMLCYLECPPFAGLEALRKEDSRAFLLEIATATQPHGSGNETLRGGRHNGQGKEEWKPHLVCVSILKLV